MWSNPNILWNLKSSQIKSQIFNDDAMSNFNTDLWQTHTLPVLYANLLVPKSLVEWTTVAVTLCNPALVSFTMPCTEFVSLRPTVFRLGTMSFKSAIFLNFLFHLFLLTGVVASSRLSDQWQKYDKPPAVGKMFSHFSTTGQESRV